MEYAEKASRQLGLDLQTKALSLRDVEHYILEVMSAIEDRSSNQVGVPVYASVEMAHDDAVRVTLTGQGRTSFSGGYPWYIEIVKRRAKRRLTLDVGEAS